MDINYFSPLLGISAESNENGQVSAGPENNYKDVKGYDNVFDTLGKP